MSRDAVVATTDVLFLAFIPLTRIPGISGNGNTYTRGGAIKSIATWFLTAGPRNPMEPSYGSSWLVSQQGETGWM